MSKRNIEKRRLLDEFEYDFGIDRELRRMSKSKWKTKVSKKDKHKT